MIPASVDLATSSVLGLRATVAPRNLAVYQGSLVLTWPSNTILPVCQLSWLSALSVICEELCVQLITY